MRINSLNIQNFRGLGNLRLDFNRSLNVLVGVNGVGKSTILDAIAVLVSGFLAKMEIGFHGWYEMALPDIKNDLDKLVLVSRITSMDMNFRVIFELTRQEAQRNLQSDAMVDVSFDMNGGSNILTRFNSVKDTLKHELASGFPFAAHYPTNRHVIDIPLLAVNGFQVPQRQANSQLQGGTAINFHEFFDWFRNTEDAENEERVRNAEYRDPQLDAVKRAIAEFTGFKNIQVKRKQLYLEVEKEGVKLDIRKMSDGEKCLFALVGDMARRLAIANPGLDDPLTGEGIVLIDEVELHLHPGWQRTLIPKFTTTFPNCQFIVTTHSPQVLGEVKAENIIILKQDDQGEIVATNPAQSFGLDSGLILEALMDTAPRSAVIDRKVRDIFELVDKEDFPAAKRKIEEVRSLTNGDIPDTVKAAAEIAMLEG